MKLRIEVLLMPFCAVKVRTRPEPCVFEKTFLVERTPFIDHEIERGYVTMSFDPKHTNLQARVTGFYRETGLLCLQMDMASGTYLYMKGLSLDGWRLNGRVAMELGLPIDADMIQAYKRSLVTPLPPPGNWPAIERVFKRQ